MFWLRRHGTDRGSSRETEQQVETLKTALAKCRSMAARGRQVYREHLAAVALLMLGFGAVIGAYRAPIKQAAIGLFYAGAEGGYSAYQKGNYGVALERLRPLAENGDARAQSTLGLIYYRGGRGVPRNDSDALKWFRLAASQGDTDAEFNLGVMYADGQGVPQDDAEAARWYRRAADKGNARAQYNLGLWYAKGSGGAPDYVRAYIWFNLAAARFPESDMRDRSAAVGSRDAMAARMTSDQIAAAQRQSSAWQPK